MNVESRSQKNTEVTTESTDADCQNQAISMLSLAFEDEETIDLDDDQAQPVAAEHTGTKVLIIDDSATVVRQMTICLEVEKCNVFTTFSGKWGLTVLDKNPGIKLVFLDINMEGLNGFETLERIRKSASKNVMLIMLTTESAKEKVLETRKLGIQGWIIKLANQVQLKAIIDENRLDTMEN